MPRKDVAVVKAAMIREEEQLPNNASEPKRRSIAPTPGVAFVEPAELGIVGVIQDNVKTLDQVLIGNKVIVFGYPISLGLQTKPQLHPHRPLLRRGMVAGQNLQRKAIVLDCPVYQGNSGGLVMQIETKNVFEKHFFVIGVVGEFVPFIDQGQRSTFVALNNSGYSIAIPMDFVLELVN